MTCSSCGSHDFVKFSRTVPPGFAIKKARQKGWDISKRIACAECQSKRKEVKLPTLTIPPAPSDDAKVAQRLFVRVMEDEAYDEPNKRYKPGFSDAKMSEDIGLSLKHVENLRDRFFGPAGEPDEISAVRNEIKELQSLLGKLVSKFDSVCVKNGFKQ